ncbi:MAG: hypothetical protein K0R38_453 [Polyangiaceae bacterium]|jgi:hypothetical protein|nr:hypothetical protein [Polyangiaceae bacterium]
MFWPQAPWVAAVSLLLLPKLSHAEDTEGVRSLLDDVARVVRAEEVDDWFTDKEALKTIEEHVLPSVCHASVEARQGALASLQQSAARAGDAKALFEQGGVMDDEVDAALTANRRLRGYEQALARQNECPFWIRPKVGFHGLQSDRKRLTLSVESGGNVQFRYTQQHLTFGAGGSGRVLAGWGFDGKYTLLFGPEFGGSALLRPNTNASEFVINYFPAVPVVLRSRALTWHYEVEAAPVALFEADNTRLSWGARLGGAFAFTALRRRNVLPWAGLAVSYEYYFEGGGREPTHFFRGGLRIGLPWEP